MSVPFTNLTWANPELLWLSVVPPIWLVLHFTVLKKKNAWLNVSNLPGLEKTKTPLRARLLNVPPLFRFFAMLLFVVALARPQSQMEEEHITREVVDIVISLDISGSMLAEDFKPNRIEAAKKLAIDFIKMRPQDRIGLVIFAGEAFTQVPLTTDHAYLIDMFEKVDIGFLMDGTAIGDGLATAVARLRDSEAASQVVILLTDGVNNRGLIDPMTAAEIAREMGVRVYSIGVGSEGTAPYPFRTPFGIEYRDMPVEIDEELCKQISAMTGGKYYRATDIESMQAVYEEIDRLERTLIEVDVFRYRNEAFFPFAFLGILLLAFEWLLRHTLLRMLI